MLIMFAVIETSYNANGEKIDSDTVAEFATETEANEHVEWNATNFSHPDAQGNYAKWHVEALR